jgi:asparagine synthase (glutamine-hydrolysing)
MSAIAGVWHLRGGVDGERSCRDMLRALAALGPDGSHLVQRGSFAAGRNLFRTLPEDRYDAGVLTGADGSCLLVADLRIDNRPELAEALGLPQPQAGKLSDAALLLAGLERWGEAILDRLVGDFAFAWFDERSSRLTLARDPLGQRPLFWHRGKSLVAFASMPQGLHALADISTAPNLDLAARFAALLPQVGPSSFHEHIRRVEPGHVVTVTPAGETSRRYWTPRPRALRLSTFGDYVEAYRAQLDQAVASRLRGADGLVATHLSGGWDSSAVTATAARLFPDRVIAYTSIPGDDQARPDPRDRFADESGLARATAALYPNIQHELIRNPAGSLVAYLDHSIGSFERPPFNLCNHDWLSGIRTNARGAGASVLLSGEIGNWTISSAPTTLLADYIRQWRLFEWAREAGGAITHGRARIRGVLASSFGPWVPTALWRRIATLSSAPSLEIPLRPAYLERLQDEIAEQSFGPISRPKDYHQRTAAGLSQMDFGQYRKGILGGWGIDKRDATADVRLIEFTMSLPLEMLLSNGQRRPLARAALADRLPAAVLDERRKGYQAADWHVGLRRHLADAYRLLDRIEGDPRAADMLDTGKLRRWLDEMPSDGWHRQDVIARYRTSLLFALAAGHFIVSTGS